MFERKQGAGYSVALRRPVGGWRAKPLEWRIHWILRVAVGLEFIGHGAFGVMTKEAWLPYYDLFGIPSSTAVDLMPLTGMVDIALGLSVLLRPTRAPLLYMAVWGLYTATLRPLTGEGGWELVERAYNFGAPLSLLLLSGWATTRAQWFKRIREVPRLTRERAQAFVLGFRALIAAYLVGHGALGVFTDKQGLIELYHSIGLTSLVDDPAVLNELIGSFEIVLGLAVLAAPTTALLLFVCAWKLATESLFVTAGAYGAGVEVIERAGAYAAPVALIWLSTIVARYKPGALATRLRRVEVVAAVALAGALAVSAGHALAQGPVNWSCGQTITADTTLDGDLVDCPNNGIVIGADGITLDLNGHTVAGNGELLKKCPKGEFCDVGLLNDGHDGVTVRDGSVRDFGTGVFVGKARQNRVLGISSSRNHFFGFIVAESARSVVRDSSGNANPAPDGDGMGLFGSHHIRILNNSFRRNAQLGIHVVDSTDNLIKGNRLVRNSDFGIIMEGDRNQVRGNRCARNGACIIVAPGNRNVIARNRISRDGDGIGIEKGRGNVVAGNVVVRARKGGIYLGLDEPPLGPVATVVRRNVVRGSDGDAFSVRAKAAHSLLRGNIARGAADDGFDVESRSAKLTRSRAVRNADLGIEAVPRVIDGGGNKAGRNGNPLQCTNIFCK